METTQSLPLEVPLSLFEARVLGCLIEKEMATPEYYPLTTNALVAACNQKSNREPLMLVGNGEVEAALEGLRTRRLASVFAGAEARVTKHKHTLDLVFPLERAAIALLAELLLRGPQTTASLRANAERLHPMSSDPGELEAVLAALAERPAGALIRKLPKQAGQKEARWMQRLTGDLVPSTGGEVQPVTVSLVLPPDVDRRLASLEADVAGLRAELAALKASLGGS